MQSNFRTLWLTFAGLRNAELCSLRREDLDFAKRRIVVPCDDVRIPKGRRYRIIPMAPELTITTCLPVFSSSLICRAIRRT